MTNVLFVCLGNICRSPMAEGIFKEMVAKQHLQDKIHIDSAGISSEEEGNQPHPGAQPRWPNTDWIFRCYGPDRLPGRIFNGRI
ncbi:low molecular weight protein tyrosine phosphatase [Lentilactobacillus farraginis DSM 18382 = JCM 14108]|uniref:protein-tyrosine-phosphatase n=1 Tax=Lentilactobacillus farraginis DSM 18382 = JCM 14108 TaxID=1423743 RepID=X0QCM2_9LACO|nr:low molecular weight protein tyrosine phosphatase [Lentilactobacillus farraginis DSM 18382 = JCM 14108]